MAVINYTAASHSAVGSTDTLAYGSAVATGDMLIATCRVGNTVTLNSVSDSVNAGNWTLAQGPTTQGVAIQYTFYMPNSGAGTPTLTFTFSASGSSPRYEILEVTNTTGAGAFDTSNNNTAASGTTGDGGAVTPATNYSAIIGLMSAAANQGYVQSGAYAILGVEPAAGTSRLVAVYQEVTSGGTYTPIVTQNTAAWIGHSIVIKQNAPPSVPYYYPTKVANRNVGPMALRFLFRQPTFTSPATVTGPQTFTHTEAGALTTIGNLFRRTSVTRTGGLTLSGVLIASKTVLFTLAAATLSLAGTLGTRFGKGLSGVLALIGGQTKRTAHDLRDIDAPTCTLVIGYSQTSNWFTETAANAYEDALDFTKYELLWNSGGAVHFWADPNYAGWSNALVNPCASGSGSPERAIFDVSDDFFLGAGDVPTVVQNIKDVINNIHSKYPSVRTVLLQTVVGGPGHQICYYLDNPVDPVRASSNQPFFDTAIAQVIADGANPAIDVRASISPEVTACSDYRDNGGHLYAGAPAAAIGYRIGRWHADVKKLNVSRTSAALAGLQAKLFSAVLALAGAQIRFIRETKTAVLSLGGATTKFITHGAFVGALALHGVLIASKAFLWTMVGALSFSGVIPVKTIGKLNAGALAATGTLPRFIRSGQTAVLALAGSRFIRATRSLTGGLSLVGGFIASKAFLRTLVGSLALSGSRFVSVRRTLSGVLAAIGSVVTSGGGLAVHTVAMDTRVTSRSYLDMQAGWRR